MNEIRILTCTTFDSSDYPGAVNSQSSLTIPDQSLTIRELLERYTRGLPLGVGNSYFYESDNDEITDDELLNKDFPSEDALTDITQNSLRINELRDSVARAKESVKAQAATVSKESSAQTTDTQPPTPPAHTASPPADPVGVN